MINTKKIFSWSLVILWMILIFYLSHQPRIESDNLSKGIAEKTIETVKKIAPKARFNPRRFNHLLRKSAHFIAYLILAALTMNALGYSKVYGYRAIAMALAISVLYAISDEVHQLFVPGRGGQVKDVFIDSFGAITGILIYSLVRRLEKK